MWDRATGQPVHNAIVWQDTRTDRAVRRAGAGDGGPATASAAPPACRWRPTSPAPSCAGCSTTSPAPRGAGRGRRAAVRHHRHLADLEPDGRPDGGVHVTDVTNASRTMLMNLRHAWTGTPSLLAAMGIPRGDAARRSARRARSMARRDGRCWRACRWPATSATSRRRCSARPASPPARPRTPTAPAASCCSTPARRRCRPSNGLLTTRRLPARRRAAGLRAGGLHRHRRRAGAVAARQPRPDPHGGRDRDAGPHAWRTTAASIRAGLLRPVRAATGTTTRAA